MSATTYFTNITNAFDRQKRYFCDPGEENSSAWSKSNFDGSASQDSNSSASTSNSTKRLVIFKRLILPVVILMLINI